MGQPVDDGRDGAVELLLGERPFVVAQEQPVGEALVAGRQRLAAVHVEQGHVPEQRPAVAPDGRLDVGRRPVVGAR